MERKRFEGKVVNNTLRYLAVMEGNVVMEEIADEAFVTKQVVCAINAEPCH